MIITVQGNFGKKNKSVLATAMIGGMAAVTNGSKTLILQLIDKDMDSVESMFTGLSKDANTFGKNDGTTSFANEGIDALLRAADNTKLTADDFRQYCTSFNKKDHGLDVTQMTEINNFREVCKTKIESVKKICKNAKEYYENILILMPTGDEELSREINGDGEEHEGFADMSIYCLKQGHVKTEHYFGRKIIFLVTDFDSASKFSLKSMRKIYCQKGDSIYKIERNVGCNDAYLSGKLLEFILTNRDAKEYDTNYQWAKDVKAVVNQIENLDAKADPVNYEWEKILIEEEKHLRTFPETIIDMEEQEYKELEEKKESQPRKKRSIFIKNKRQENPPVADKESTQEESVGLHELEEMTSEEIAEEIEKITGSEIENVKLEECDDPEDAAEFEPVDFTEEESAQKSQGENDDFVLEVDVEDAKEENKLEDDEERLKKLYEDTTDEMLREAFEQDGIEPRRVEEEMAQIYKEFQVNPIDEKQKHFEEHLAKKVNEIFSEELTEETEDEEERYIKETLLHALKEVRIEEPVEEPTDTTDDWNWDEPFNSDENSDKSSDKSSDENERTIQQMQSQMDQLSRQLEELAKIVISQTERKA